MRTPKPLEYVTLAVPVAMAIALACSDTALTAPQKFQPVAPSQSRSVTDDDGSGNCTNLSYEPKATNGGTADADVNGNGTVCIAVFTGKKK